MRAIDLFAGWGGFTLGATQAGAEVVYAANHWPLAVEVHSRNHPTTLHACQDLRQADWTALPEFELLLASPACQGHSRASQPGRRAYHDAMRQTAWAVVDCAEVRRPRTIVVENVVSFLEWPLFGTWKQALEILGYAVTTNVVRASHLGVPQRRDRLFIVASEGAIELDIPAVAEPGFAPFIEDNASGWRPISGAQPGARARLHAASRRWGRCLSQHVTGHPGVPLDQPIRTITTKDQWCVVEGRSYRPLTLREYARAMGFPDSYALPDASRADVVRGLGNAVVPAVAREVVRQVMIGRQLPRR